MNGESCHLKSQYLFELLSETITETWDFLLQTNCLTLQKPQFPHETTTEKLTRLSLNGLHIQTFQGPGHHFLLHGQDSSSQKD